jgi:hypothetical protein
MEEKTYPQDSVQAAKDNVKKAAENFYALGGSKGRAFSGCSRKCLV